MPRRMSSENATQLHVWVNGEEHFLQVAPDALLIDVLRGDLALTGTKRVCDIGVCGACTVLLDGKSTTSCLMLALKAQDRRLTTVEGLGGSGKLHPVQQAFLDEWGFQCGFCTPGMLLTAVELLNIRPKPDAAWIRSELVGNLCRCTGYDQIVRAVLRAAELAAEPATSADEPK